MRNSQTLYTVKKTFFENVKCLHTTVYKIIEHILHPRK